MPTDANPDLEILNQRIAMVRDNLTTLMEQAASYSGAQTEELISARIEQQQKLLDDLQAQKKAIEG